jgi:hypothetical protein
VAGTLLGCTAAVDTVDGAERERDTSPAPSVGEALSDQVNFLIS